MRIIARLDVKGPNLIKTVQLEGLRVLGSPGEFSRKYYAAGIDEILYMDAVASLYDRNSLLDLVRETVREVFIPITVGGGIRTLSDMEAALRSGADKVAVNTAVVRNPALISEAARRFGSQCLVVSIEAKGRGAGQWEAYTHNGREHTGLDAVEWAARAADLGAGEILLTSVDREGTAKGFDLELLRRVSEQAGVPVIISGGMGRTEEISAAAEAGADAVAVARLLHFGQAGVEDIRARARELGVPVRRP